MLNSIQGRARTMLDDWRKRRTSNLQIFSSRESAIDACDRGYEADEITDVVVAKTRALRDRLMVEPPVLDASAFRVLTALALAPSGPALRVMDFGGAAGQHYFVVQALTKARPLDWRVVETPAMVEAAQPLADRHLSFFESIEGACQGWDSPPDLVFASGVLMFVPNPLSTLRNLLDVGADLLFLTRTGLTEDLTTLHAVQSSWLGDNGPGPLPAGFQNRIVTYASTFVPARDVYNVITDCAYRIVARFDEGRDVWRSAQCSVHQYGLICRRTHDD